MNELDENPIKENFNNNLEENNTENKSISLKKNSLENVIENITEKSDKAQENLDSIKTLGLQPSRIGNNIKENYCYGDEQKTLNNLENTLDNVDSSIKEFGNTVSESITDAFTFVSQKTDYLNKAIDDLENTVGSNTNKYFNTNNNFQTNNQATSTISPALLVVLSVIIPGLGQLILGQVLKGILIFIGYCIIVLIATFISCGVLTLPVGAILSVLIALDTYNCANKQLKGEKLGDFEFIITKD